MLRWKVLSNASEAAATGAAVIAEALERAVVERGEFQVAVSGGSNTQLLTMLGRQPLAWQAGHVYQVDERVAPAGDAARNLVTLRESVPAATRVHAMPVEDPDLDAAAVRYALELPDVFDVVQLGLGDDGHTASLVPGDSVLDVTDRGVAMTRVYRGHRRMTLTYPVLNRARLIVWVATGPAKRRPLEQLVAGDGSIPAAGVKAADQVVICDEAAAPAVIW